MNVKCLRCEEEMKTRKTSDAKHMIIKGWRATWKYTDEIACIYRIKIQFVIYLSCGMCKQSGTKQKTRGMHVKRIANGVGGAFKVQKQKPSGTEITKQLLADHF